MKISYKVASEILNKLIEENFASPRIGSYPCIILKGHFKILKKYIAITKINLIIRFSIPQNPDIFLH